MDNNAAISATILLGVIASLTPFASTKFGEPDKGAAVAAAIRGVFVEMAGEDMVAKGDGSFGPFPLCLESEVSLDIAAVADSLSETTIRPVPIADCSSETIEGDFGMFTAIVNYFDQHGEEAAHLTVVKADCPTNADCVIEIDYFSFGNGYRVERKGSRWTVTASWLHWIV